MYGARAPLLDAPAFRRYGLPEYRQAPSPAAGANFTFAVDGLAYARLVSVFVRLVTDATVANRELALEYRDAEGNRYALTGAGQTQAASLTRDYFFSSFREAVTQPVILTLLAPLDPIILPPTHDFRIVVDAIAAGDQLSRIRFVWERFYSDVHIPGPEPK